MTSSIDRNRIPRWPGILMGTMVLCVSCGWMGAAEPENDDRMHVTRGRHGMSAHPGHVEDKTDGKLWEFSLTTAWDSRYVLEGRDMLDGDGLVGTAAAATYDDITVELWYALGPAADYIEFNALAAYVLHLGDFDLHAGYNHLQFVSDEIDDNEVSVGLAYTGLPFNLAADVDWYHSFEADGSFVELVVGTEYELGDTVVLAPAALLGMNAGYIADGHNGLNNVALQLEATAPIGDYLELGAYGAYTWAIDEDTSRYEGDELLQDFFYGGVSLGATY
jgi:hypothetical protein